MDAIENMEKLMSGNTVPNWPVISMLLAVAACAPRVGDGPNDLSIAAVAQPPPIAPDGDCGSASVHESRRDGNIDCFYAWNHGLATCARGS